MLCSFQPVYSRELSYPVKSKVGLVDDPECRAITDLIVLHTVGDNVLLGPDSLGQFIPTSIKSIQKKRVDVETAEAGQSVS